MGKCEVEVYSRVTGFMRPVKNWNKGKREELKDRKKFNTKVAKDTRSEQLQDIRHTS